MEFTNRIKKEMTEGIVLAILVDAGYRVIGLGIENVIRETECLTALEYAGLDFPKAMKSLPDLLVMDKVQTEKHLVEVKYRSTWNSDIFDEIEEQVHLYKQLVLVYLNRSPPLPKDKKSSPGSYLRCCKVRSINNVLEAYLYDHEEMKWMSRAEIGEQDGKWWGLRPIQRSAAALSKHLAQSLCQVPSDSRRLLCPDRPAAGKRHTDSTLKSLPRYRGFSPARCSPWLVGCADESKRKKG